MAEPIDPNEIRLDGKLKDRVGQQIVTAIDDGHNTFARLRKAIPVLHIPNLNGPSLDIEMPDRVLKSALGHVMRGKLHRVRVVKVSPKVYGVQRR